MSYSAEILADSISPAGVRLTTLLVTFPRFILAEVNTHRMLSRNSASSRAIPPEKQIQKVLDDPFVPVFGSRVTGMGEGHLEANKQARAQAHWLNARDHAVQEARALLVLDIDKSRINRLLEPFMWHTAIISATEWSNFFALRDNPAAQGEFQIIAHMMRLSMEKNRKIHELWYDQWHLPLVSPIEKRDISAPDVVKLSVSRCARVSYDKQHDEEDLEKSLKRYEMLLSSGHLSPFEHAACPLRMDSSYTGNLRGWRSHRSQIPNQHDAALMQAA